MGSRFVRQFGVSLMWLASIGVLVGLVSSEKIGYGLALTLGIFATVAVIAWSTYTDVCPRCQRALYSPYRSRCRVCGLKLH